jgi:hypothetical protein
MTKAGFEVRALSRLDAGQVIEYRNTEWVRFQPMALQYSNDLNQIQQISIPGAVDATVDDDTLTWTDGYGPGRSLSWQAQTARLAKLLTVDSLANLPAVDQFILDGGNPVLELNLIFAHSSGVTPYVNGQPWGKGANAGDRDTQGLVEFRDDAGNVLWWFNLPRSWDSEGNEQLGTFRFKKQGNSLYVSHRVPLSFVQGAVYPLFVDTTIDDQVEASADDGWSNEGGSFTSIATNGLLGKQILASTNSLYGLASGSAGVRLNIFADDIAAPTAPTTEPLHTGKTRTTNFVVMDGSGPVDEWVQSDSLNTVIQELADDYDPSAIQILHDDDGSNAFTTRSFKSYDADTALAPKLHIEYTEVGGETRSLAGAQPAATGTLTRIEQGLRAIVGSQPAATGALARIEQALRALAGNQPTATGTLARVFGRPRSMAGSQPAPAGTLVRIEQALRALEGSQPAATGILVRVEQALRILAGDQPASAGILTRVEQAKRTLVGDQPAPSGTLAAELTALARSLEGDQPAPSGVLTRIEQALRVLAGNQPNPTGVLVRKEQALRALVGSQPAPSGTLSAQKVTLRALAGNQPASSATLDRFAQMARSLAGSQLTAVGILIRIEQALRAISGDQPASAAILTGIKPTAVTRLLVGNQPSATGTLRTITAVPMAVTLILRSGTLTIVLKDATLSTKLYSGSLSLIKRSRN